MTNNQLIDRAIYAIERYTKALTGFPDRLGVAMDLELARIALAALTATQPLSDAERAELQERRKADNEPVAWTSEEAIAEVYCDETGMIGPKHMVGDVPLYRHAQQPVVPEGLNPDTGDLVLRFASALADKLYKAEQKYGRSTDWMKSDWYNDCLQSLWEHIEKGDPRDVAAYCAFMWHHGWVTTDYDRNVQNACRAAILQAKPVCTCPSGDGSLRWPCQVHPGNSPVIPEGYVMVPKEPTKEMIDAGWLYFMGTKNPSSKGAYKAMLAAAPQEVKGE